MSWIDPKAHNLAQVFCHNTAVAQGLDAFTDALWGQGYVAATTLELCRLRIATMLHCESELHFRHEAARAAGLAEDKIGRLPSYAEHPSFSAAERACLSFTEVYCQDPQAISDELAAAVVDHYGDAGLVVLVQALGIFNGMARMAQLLDVDTMEASNGG